MTKFRSLKYRASITPNSALLTATILAVATSLSLAGCGEEQAPRDGAVIFPSDASIPDGLRPIKFGDACEVVVNKLRDKNLLYVEGGKDIHKGREAGMQLTLKEDTYMGLNATPVIFCETPVDKVSQVGIVNVEEQRDTAKFDALIEEFTRKFGPPSRRIQEAKKAIFSNETALFPSVYWDNLSGTTLNVGLNWATLSRLSQIEINLTPAATQAPVNKN